MIEGEPLLKPEAAREWVLEHHDVTEIEGQLVAEEGVPHTCLAGIAIASGTESRYLSEVYRELPHHRGPLSNEVLLRMATLVASVYQSEEE